MPQRVITAGGGRTGARTATILGSHGQDTIIVEQDSDRCEQLVEECESAIVGSDAILEHSHRIWDRSAGGFDLIEVDVDPRSPAAKQHLYLLRG